MIPADLTLVTPSYRHEGELLRRYLRAVRQARTAAQDHGDIDAARSLDESESGGLKACQMWGAGEW